MTPSFDHSCTLFFRLHTHLILSKPWTWDVGIDFYQHEKLRILASDWIHIWLVDLCLAGSKELAELGDIVQKQFAKRTSLLFAIWRCQMLDMVAFMGQIEATLALILFFCYFPNGRKPSKLFGHKDANHITLCKLFFPTIAQRDT